MWTMENDLLQGDVQVMILLIILKEFIIVLILKEFIRVQREKPIWSPIIND